jgi:hypothetical protein
MLETQPSCPEFAQWFGTDLQYRRSSIAPGALEFFPGSLFAADQNDLGPVQ